jgi:uncharacterized membrane protein
MPGRRLPRVPARLTAGLQRPALPLDPAVRAAAAIGLIAVGIIHVLEIQGQRSGAAWLTAGLALLAACAPVAGLWLLARPSSAAWGFSGLVCFLAAAGYILTRSVPVPGDAGDRGNWLDPLGVAALFTEGIVTILAVLVLASMATPGRRGTSTPAGPQRRRGSAR